MEYDVFISCKSEDYKYAEEIYDFLNKNGIHTFLASKELRKMGDSEYRRAIIKAFKSSYHMIVFGSNAEYINNEHGWVYYEWDLFVNAKLKGKKKGQILTVLSGIEVDDLDPALWKYESFTYDNYKERILTYVNTQNSEKRKAEKAIRQKDEEERKRQSIIKEIVDTTKGYSILKMQENTLFDKLCDLNEKIGKTQKKCAVCNNVVPIQNHFCDQCGWQFPLLYSIGDDSEQEFELLDKKQLSLARINWSSLEKMSHAKLDEKNFEDYNNLKQLNDELSHDKEELKNAVAKNEKYIKELETKISVLESEKRKHTQNLDPILQNLINNMIRVEGGTFTMGATSEQGSDANSDEKPAHQVTLSSFSIGKYEVTQEEWEAVMGTNPSHFKGAKHPVECVSWNDCQEFIRRLNQKTGRNFRLPTEAEWEYAARGGNWSKGYKYAGSNNIESVAWYEENSASQTHPVGTKSANELGLCDMSGNVWEWCSDWYGNYSSSSQTNPQGPSSGSFRVCRGGSWFNNAGDCRVSIRSINPSHIDIRISLLGLRLAL